MKSNKVGPFVLKHKETGLYFTHENDVENIEHADKFKITTYAYFFFGKRVLEYKDVPFNEEKLKIIRKNKLKEL
jgi:hypothetical protein